MNHNRIEWLDLAKGISISIVMLFHIKGILQVHYSAILEVLLFSSCMLPPFFSISGLFFHPEENFNTFIVKKTRRLLIPFIFFYLLSAVIIPNILHYFGGITFNTVVGWPSLWAFIWPGEYPNIPLWFLWCLYLANIFFWLICHFSKRFFPNHFQTTIVILSILSAIIGFSAKNILSTDIGNIFAALQNIPYICIGFLFAKHGFLKKLSDSSKKEKSFLTVIFLLAALIVSSPICSETLQKEEVLFYLQGITGSFLILSLSSLIVSLPLISYLGRYSIIILLTHGLLVRACIPFTNYMSQFVNDDIATILCWIFMALSYLLIIPLCRILLPKIIPFPDR